MIGRGDADAIVAAFGLGPVTSFEGPVARGELGQVWRLQTPSGTWAVKESLGGVVPDDGELEAATAFHEAACAAGIPAPSVQRATDGAATAVAAGTPVWLYGWVDLTEPDLLGDPVEVATVVAALHRLRFDGGPPEHPWYSRPVGAARWDALITELASSGSPLAGRLARWRGELVALEGWLTPPRSLQCCHRDLFADNLRWTTAGVPCVIDWDNAGAADPRQELALVLFEFAADDAGRARALYSAYRDAGGPARIDRRGDFSMAIAVLGHLTERIGRLWLAPGATADHQARQERRFDEVDDRPFTREVIDRLLDAIA